MVDVVTLAARKLEISDAVCSLFDELKAEGGYLRYEEMAPSHLYSAAENIDSRVSITLG